jgi:drug/metabolite transporter (DMT)-like permease
LSSETKHHLGTARSQLLAAVLRSQSMMGSSILSEAYLGVVLAVLAAIGYSTKSIFVKLAYLDGADAVTLLALRMLFSVPFFIAIALWARGRSGESLSAQDWMRVVLLGLVGYYLTSLFDFLGLQYISASLERLILFLYPTMTVLILAAFRKHAVDAKTIAAMVLSYAGIALVFLHDVGAKEGGIVLGSALVFASTLSYSIYLVCAGQAIARIGAMRFTAYSSLVASAAYVLQFVLARPIGALDLPLRVYELSIAMAIFSTVLPVFLLSFAIRRIGSGSASLIGSIGPVSTIYMAYVILGESLSLLQIAGSALVLVGVLIISLNSQRARA